MQYGNTCLCCNHSGLSNRQIRQHLNDHLNQPDCSANDRLHPHDNEMGNISVSSNIMGNISAYDGQPEISHEQSLEMYPADDPNELCDYTVGDIMIDYEAWDGAEDLSESESEDGNYDEVSDILDDTSLEEEDKELLLHSFLTMDIDNDAHYIHQLS